MPLRVTHHINKFQILHDLSRDKIIRKVFNLSDFKFPVYEKFVLISKVKGTNFTHQISTISSIFPKGNRINNYVN